MNAAQIAIITAEIRPFHTSVSRNSNNRSARAWVAGFITSAPAELAKVISPLSTAEFAEANLHPQRQQERDGADAGTEQHHRRQRDAEARQAHQRQSEQRRRMVPAAAGSPTLATRPLPTIASAALGGTTPRPAVRLQAEHQTGERRPPHSSRPMLSNRPRGSVVHNPLMYRLTSTMPRMPIGMLMSKIQRQEK